MQIFSPSEPHAFAYFHTAVSFSILIFPGPSQVVTNEPVVLYNVHLTLLPGFPLPGSQSGVENDNMQK